MALAVGVVRSEAVVVRLHRRRRGGVAGRGLARFAPAAPWWHWLAAAWCWHAHGAVVARLVVQAIVVPQICRLCCWSWRSSGLLGGRLGVAGERLLSG
jgi:hypothetical protein